MVDGGSIPVDVYEHEGLIAFHPREFLGDAFFRFRAACDGSKYSERVKLNLAPVAKAGAIVERLRTAGFEVRVAESAARLLAIREEATAADEEAAERRAAELDERLRARGQALYPFQRDGVRWLAPRMGALLCDEMGLGKTIQAFGAMPSDQPRALVIAPSVAKGVWKREAARWRPDLRVSVLSGIGSFRWPERGELVVTNYDVLPVSEQEIKDWKKRVADAEAIKMPPPKPPAGQSSAAIPPEGVVMVVDEAHAIKNTTAQRTRRVRDLAVKVRATKGRTWGLTATPLLNRPPELWALLAAFGVADEAFGSWKGYADAFGARKGRWGGWVWPEVPQSDIAPRLRRVMLRRRRTEVLPDLPRKTTRYIDVDLALGVRDRAKLEKLGADLAPELEQAIDAAKKTGEAGKIDFEKFSAARALLATAKIAAMLSLVEEYEEQEEPLVVFSAHRAPIDILAKRPGWAVITGDTSPDQRTQIEEQFQAGKLRGVGGTIDAAGVAITLTRACHELFVDQDVTPALNWQAEDRVCRIGQERPVLITVLLADHFLDERITELIGIKTRLIDATVTAAEGDAEARPTLTLQLSPGTKRPRQPKPEQPFAGGQQRAVFRAPKGDREMWAAQALETLTAMDPDRAGETNGMGWSKADGGFGAHLARTLSSTGGLTDKQWTAAIRLCKRYPRQVGPCPREETDR